jgi:hypothetical protein
MTKKSDDSSITPFKLIPIAGGGVEIAVRISAVFLTLLFKEFFIIMAPLSFLF